MGKLQVIFRIQLAYPVITLMGNEQPIVIEIPATGNTVRIKAPRHNTAVKEPPFGGGEMTLIVERECAKQPGNNPSGRTRQKLGIEQDAAKAFYQFFEAIRDSALRRENTVFTYPVVPSEDIGSNPLVTSYKLEWVYEGNAFFHDALARGIPAIQISEEGWRDAASQLTIGKTIPVYRKFVLDAFYFAQHDPPRGIVMACAAWETALRYYLANISKREAVSDIRGIPTLYELAKQTRGGSLFYDWIESVSRGEPDEVYRGREIEILRRYGSLVDNLRQIRNKLLHEGKSDPTEKVTTDYALAVAAAIDWLFDYAEEES